jgi:hypothetical protein
MVFIFMALKMATVYILEKLLSPYDSTRRQNPEEHHRHAQNPSAPHANQMKNHRSRKQY